MMTTNPPAYHMQHATTRLALGKFVEGSARTVELPINHDKFVTLGLIEHGEPSKFTRSQVYAGLDLAYANCRADGPLACAPLPEKGNKAGHIRALSMGYTYGKDGAKHANLTLYGLGKHRKANRSRRNASELAVAVKAKTTVTYDGKQYANEDLARKAGCRAVHGQDWWKVDKDERLAAVKL